MTNLITPAEAKRVQATLLEMSKKASEDPVYFIDTFLYIFNPKQKPFNLRFKMFPFQKRLVREIVSAVRNGEDLFIDKTREMGVTYTVLATFIWFWLYEPASNFLIGSRKEDYVDNRRGGTTGNKEESLFGKLDYMISRLPKYILPEGFNPDKHFNFMSLVNPKNGNAISGESSNENFSRGGRQRAIFFDEFAFWDNGHSAWGATADTTNCRIIATTPGIKPSKAKRLRFGKDGEKIKVVTVLYNEDPRKDKKWIEEQKTRRSTEDFNREIMINWETSITGRVYPEIESASYGAFPFLVNQPFYCSWDFGLDGTAFLFWQQNPANGKMRLIDSYENSDKPIQWYLPFFGAPIDSKFQYTDEDLKAITEISNYPKAIHFGDPDVKKRSFAGGLSAKMELQKVKVYVRTIPKNDFYSRREVTKVYLQKGIEINQSNRNEYFLEAIKMSRYPQREETSQATTPVALPIHDWASHSRTAMEYFFINVDRFTNIDENRPAWADKNKTWRINRNSIRRR